jgi:capsular polysaccharide biosynthesis protein
MNKQTPFFESCYGKLVRLYPKAFREEYGAEMERLFAEQYEDAAKDGFLSMVSFWARTMGDFSFSVVKEHIEQLRGNMSAHSFLQFCDRKLTFGRLFAGITIILAGLCVIMTLFVLPRVYMSQAKLLIRTPTETIDPFQGQSIFEKIKSRKVIEPVIAKLNLTSALAEGAGELTVEEAHKALWRMTEVRLRLNSGVVDVRVYSGDRELSASIANEITATTMQMIAASIQADETKLKAAEGVEIPHPAAISRISVIERAAPGLKPVRPNVPLNVALGSILSAIVAVVLAGFVRLVLRTVTIEQPTGGVA